MKLAVRALALWAALILIFVAAKPLSMAFIAPGAPAAGIAGVMCHGLRHDVAVGAYIALPALLWSIVGLWVGTGRTWWRAVMRVWLAVGALAGAAAIVLNAALYPYWRFPLDMTPVDYFTSSPSAAMASASLWQGVAGVLAILILGGAYAWLLWVVAIPPRGEGKVRRGRAWATVVMACLGGVMFLGIRGGVTVSTLIPGAVYFSERQELNHAAVNPLFSLLYSATHRHAAPAAVMAMSREEGARQFAELRPPRGEQPDSVSATMLREKRPDIYLIFLESFSASLMPSLGGERVAVELDSIARSGVSFTRMYANGFRTDRGLTAVLSALPSLPSEAMIRRSDVIERSPSLASTLRRHGYTTHYYYGGDADFTNMRGYLRGTGFGEIVADSDFPVSERLSKWGVHDGPLFARVLADEGHAGSAPGRRFTVIQTSSSHEPFEVPETPRGYEEAPAPVRAFAYTDSVVGAFVRALAAGRGWDSTLVVLVADHWGAWPEDLDDAGRHHIPLIVTGGALAPDRRCLTVDAVGSQADIVPTLLAWMGIDSRDFIFGAPLTDPASPHFALWCDADRAAVLDDGGLTLLNTNTGEVMAGDTAGSDRVKGYLRTLHDYASDRKSNKPLLH